MTPPRIAYGADDANETTRAVLDHLAARGVEVVDVTGGGSWPDIGAAVGRAVAGGTADLGVVMCWTGTGTAIAANKVPGVRALSRSGRSSRSVSVTAVTGKSGVRVALARPPCAS